MHTYIHKLQNKIFWEISHMSLTFIYCALYPVILQRFKKILALDLEIHHCMILGHIGSKLPTGPKNYFLGNFTYIPFVYLLCSFIFQSFKKKSCSRYWDVTLHNIGLNWTQIDHLPQKEDFWGEVHLHLFDVPVTAHYHAKFKKSP